MRTAICIGGPEHGKTVEITHRMRSVAVWPLRQLLSDYDRPPVMLRRYDYQLEKYVDDNRRVHFVYRCTETPDVDVLAMLKELK